MNFRRILHLVSEVAEGKDNFKVGAVGHSEYGFVFRDIDYILKHIDMSYSGGICSVDTTIKVMEDWENDRIKEFDIF